MNNSLAVAEEPLRRPAAAEHHVVLEPQRLRLGLLAIGHRDDLVEDAASHAVEALAAVQDGAGVYVYVVL